VGGAGLHGLGGADDACGQPLLDRARFGCVDGQCRPGVEQYGVPDRPGLTCEETAYDLGVVRRILAAQTLGRSHRR
jgi:hypothetical protein